ncbi:hypothetical protein GCM10010961_28110 [Pseudodonghicola xiamenensis]|uniref:Uncharacterized protein n=1 Tax=Pseudodonghicola xiamenensis TaxID=337702 RepID=A0A8J3MDB7_9RHOB|nr:hypothetical protein GCM10010961_28110 [Pseudodonghicola xiamenensis]
MKRGVGPGGVSILPASVLRGGAIVRGLIGNGDVGVHPAPDHVSSGSGARVPGRRGRFWLWVKMPLLAKCMSQAKRIE